MQLPASRTDAGAPLPGQYQAVTGERQETVSGSRGRSHQKDGAALSVAPSPTSQLRDQLIEGDFSKRIGQGEVAVEFTRRRT